MNEVVRTYSLNKPVTSVSEMWHSSVMTEAESMHFLHSLALVEMLIPHQFRRSPLFLLIQPKLLLPHLIILFTSNVLIPHSLPWLVDRIREIMRNLFFVFGLIALLHGSFPTAPPSLLIASSTR